MNIVRSIIDRIFCFYFMHFFVCLWNISPQILLKLAQSFLKRPRNAVYQFPCKWVCIDCMQTKYNWINMMCCLCYKICSSFSSENELVLMFVSCIYETNNSCINALPNLVTCTPTVFSRENRRTFFLTLFAV